MPRPFNKPKSRVPTEIPVVSVTVQLSPGEEGEPSYNYTYRASVADADGGTLTPMGGEVTEHITPGQVNQLQGIVDNVARDIRASLS